MKRILCVSLLVLLFLPAAVYAYNFYFYQDYYSDGTFTTQVGYIERDCNGNIVSQWGTTTNYRRVTWINCTTGGSGVHCQQFVGGAWVEVQCPN